ncbi:hypothetical protein MHBO_001507 [Bonamia ostreae]|uniref:Endonuclease/exonuclease/phosphatase domain-containing protein n=1 Tax=Bonamia ostreae TaxID=126728 RepID=A0ABV2AJ83_9EUKA
MSMGIPSWSNRNDINLLDNLNYENLILAGDFNKRPENTRNSKKVNPNKRRADNICCFENRM